MAFALFNPFFYEVVRRQSPSHGLTTPVDFCSGGPPPASWRRHPLTLICPTPLADASFVVTGCVCLHALSSFQRTDCRCALGARPPTFSPDLRGPAPVRCRLWSRPSFGEPYETTRRSRACQPIIFAHGRFGSPWARRSSCGNRRRQVNRTIWFCFCPFRTTNRRPPIA